MTKLKNIIGVKEKELGVDIPTQVQGLRCYMEGYNSLANAEVVVDREKIERCIHNYITTEMLLNEKDMASAKLSHARLIDNKKRCVEAIATAIESGSILSLKKGV